LTLQFRRILDLLAQAVHFCLRRGGTVISPVAAAQLTAHEPDGERFNQRYIHRIAESIEKQNRQRD
jgi:hypothetical protein